jgi:uncharacterized protein
MKRPADRDRDTQGRPRSARPRDALGRPLPKTATGEPRVPDNLVLAPSAALAEADRLLASDRPFHAHEVLEASWKSAPAAERDLWQGLAQLAVGLTHAQRGNSRGAVALLRRGAVRIRAYADGPHDSRLPGGAAAAGHPHGVAVADVVTAAESLAGRIERDGLAGLHAADLRLRLRHPA